MKKRILIISGVVAVLAAIVAIPFLLPLDTYRGPIERAASAAIGREVHIRGPLHLSIYPQIGISLENVSIANAQGAKHPQMVEVDSVVVGAELMPLFSGELKVTEVVLQKPVIHFEVASNGTGNWQLGNPSQQAKPGDTNRRLSTIGVAKLRVEDAQVTYEDASSGSSQSINDVDLTLAMPLVRTQQAVRVPLSFSGSLTYNREPLRLSGNLANFEALMRSQPTSVELVVQSNIINADFRGTMGKEGNVSGALKLGAHSVRSLAAWLGHPLPAGNGFGLLALEGQFALSDGVYTLRQTHLGFDSMNLNADLAFDTKPEVLSVKGKITLDRLDINPYLAPGAKDDTVEAARARASNPDAPLALAGLKAANAELTMVVGSMVLPGFKADHGVVNVALKDGVLKTELSNLSVYGGKGRGNLTVDASGAMPSIHSSLDLADLKVQPFLSELMGVNKVTGTGSVRFDVQGQGKTAKDLVKSFNGKGDVKLADGSIIGVDLAAVARVMQSVVTAQVLTDAVGGNAKTPFGQMGGTFTVKNGVLHTTDLKLVSDTVEMSGQGDVDLSAETVDFHFEPMAKKGIPGLKLVDIGVPFNVKGPWAKPSFAPDPKGIAKAVVNKLGQGATAPIDIVKDPGGALKSLFGR